MHNLQTVPCRGGRNLHVLKTRHSSCLSSSVKMGAVLLNVFLKYIYVPLMSKKRRVEDKVSRNENVDGQIAVEDK